MFNTLTRVAGVIVLGGAAVFAGYSLTKDRGNNDQDTTEQSAALPQTNSDLETSTSQPNPDIASLRDDTTRPTAPDGTIVGARALPDLDQDALDASSSAGVDYLPDPYDEDRIAALGAGGMLGDDSDQNTVRSELGTLSNAARETADDAEQSISGAAADFLSMDEEDDGTAAILEDLKVPAKPLDAVNNAENLQEATSGLRGLPSGQRNRTASEAASAVVPATDDFDDLMATDDLAARDDTLADLDETPVADDLLAPTESEPVASADVIPENPVPSAADINLPSADRTTSLADATSQPASQPAPVADQDEETPAIQTPAPTRSRASSRLSRPTTSADTPSPTAAPVATASTPAASPSTPRPTAGETPQATSTNLVRNAARADKTDDGRYFSTDASDQMTPNAVRADKPDDGAYFSTNAQKVDKPDDGAYFTAQDSGRDFEPCVKADGTPYIGPGNALNPFAAESPCLPTATAEGYDGDGSFPVATASDVFDPSDEPPGDWQQIPDPRTPLVPTDPNFQSDYSSI